MGAGWFFMYAQQKQAPLASYLMTKLLSGVVPFQL
jgi:hypothetical protein